MKALFLLAGIIFWIMAYFAYTFSFWILFWETRPFTILAVPCALVGTLIFCYGLIAGRKITGGKTK